jgi:hypothetical protein
MRKPSADMREAELTIAGGRFYLDEFADTSRPVPARKRG